MDHDLIAEHGPTFYLTGMDSCPAIVIRCDDEYLITSWALAQPTDRYGDDLTFRTDRNPDTN